jgi:hypothetical protein
MDITLNQVRISSETGFSVANEVTAATDITKFLFVLKYETDEYDRVATVHDIENYPETKTQGVPWYRAVSVTKEYDNLADAQAFADYVKTRLDRVVTNYYTFKGTFEGTEDTVITAP